MSTLLVVCHANVARSPAAAALLRAAVDERGDALDVRSAGTHATEGQPASARTRGSLAEAAPDRPAAEQIPSHRAHQLTDADLDEADLVVCMEASQVRFIRRTSPRAADRTATIGHLASQLPCDGRTLTARVASMVLGEHEPDDITDVEDPAGGDDEVYIGCMRELVALCDQLSARLAGPRA